MRIRKLVFPALLIAAIIVACQFWPTNRTLTSNAVRLLDAKQWYQYESVMSPAQYVWTGGASLLHTGWNDAGEWTVSFCDTRLTSEQPVAPQLAKALLDTSYDRWYVNPDGSRVALDSTGKSGLHTLASMNMNGSVERSSDYDSLAGWSGPSSYVSWTFTEKDSGELTLTTTEHQVPRGDHTLVRSSELASALKNSHNLQAAGGRLFTVDFVNREAPLVVEPLDRAMARHYAVELPRDWGYDQHVVSPGGKLIAWILHAKPTDKYPKLVRTLFPFMNSEIPARTGIWISDSMGRNMRPIGYCYEEPESNIVDHDPPPAISMVEWLPDERAISFLHEKALYVVRVD